MAARPRVVWAAGTRSALLRLGPIYRALAAEAAGRRDAPVHWLVVTGEQGAAAYQVIDALGLRPDTEFEIRHPVEDPALRLNGLMADIELLVRRRDASRLVFAGFGPAAAASALVCHARCCRGLWLKPFDPADLNRRRSWEGGLEKIVHALDGDVTTLDPPWPDKFPDESLGEAPSHPESYEPEGRRAEAPLILIAVGRYLWGFRPGWNGFVEAFRAWADALPGADFLLMRNLDAGLEGRLKNMSDPPANLLSSIPVPFSVYRGWLARAAAVATDSPHVAAESMAMKIPVIAVGETQAAMQGSSAAQNEPLHVAPGDLGSDEVKRFLEAAIEKPPEANRPNVNIWKPSGDTIDAVRDWING